MGEVVNHNTELRSIDEPTGSSTADWVSVLVESSIPSSPAEALAAFSAEFEIGNSARCKVHRRG
jgi:hypothetical protein